jgi:Mechanosensitive ion channel, conserved TM helix
MIPVTVVLQSQLSSVSNYYDATVGQVVVWAPKLLAAVAILVVAFLIGKALSYAAAYAIDRTSFGQRSTANDQKLGPVIGRALFWIVMLISLPAAMGALGLSSLIQPLEQMAQQFLAFLPNLIGAGLIFGIGTAIATVAQRATTSVLEATQADQLAERFGMAKVTGQANVSKFAGVLVFTLLIVPVAIAALDALAIQSIAQPAKDMLSSFLSAIPHIFAAAIVLLLSFLIARFAADTLTNLLPTLGFDHVGKNIGVSQEVFGKRSLSTIASYVAFAAIMLFGTIEAAKLLNFAVVSELLTHLLALGGQILLGTAIIVFGVVVADFVHGIVSKSKDAKPMAGFIKIAIIILVTAMGLRQMGVANEIINTGFTLLMGAMAFGAAIAIGWGGKDTAGRLLEKWTKDL